MIIDPKCAYPRCAICGLIAEVRSPFNWGQVDCVRCGRYRIEADADAVLRETVLSDRQIANISGYLADTQNFKIAEDDVDFLLGLTAPTVIERATKLLKYLAKNQPNLGKGQDITEWAVLNRLIGAFGRSPATKLSGSPFQKYGKWIPLLSATWSEDYNELIYILEQCLQHQMDFVEVKQEAEKRMVTILPKGWAHLENLPQGVSSVGFVAMWFADEMNIVWEHCMYPAIRDAGYKPERIDKKEHNNKIDDEIVASIRAAKFVVADFTGHRGGVYYEAGLAQGRDKPVIWSVREDHLKDAHFDTRQYNHIVWSLSDLPTFRIALRQRIEASIGKGPIRASVH